MAGSFGAVVGPGLMEAVAAAAVAMWPAVPAQAAIVVTADCLMQVAAAEQAGPTPAPELLSSGWLSGLLAATLATLAPGVDSLLSNWKKEYCKDEQFLCRDS